METRFGSGHKEERELIAVSFIENLPRSTEDGGRIRDLLGPSVQKQVSLTEGSFHEKGMRVRACIELPVDAGWRRSGWRAACEIEGLAASDGSTRFGFKAVPVDADRFEPGSMTIAELWFWTPELPEPGLAPEKSIRIIEGKAHVASGTILDIARD
jgi:hypothetical protein